MDKNIDDLNKLNKIKEPDLVQSVDRAMNLLLIIAKHKSPILASEMSQMTGLNRTTIWRLLGTLEHHDLVEQNPINKTYQLGFTATRLSSSENQYSPLIRKTYKYLQQLNSETGETVLLSVPQHFSTLTIYQINALHSVRLVDYVYKRLPLHCTSNGKLLLSQLSKPELDIILEEPLQQLTQKTITNKSKLLSEIDLIRKQEYAIVLGELDINENGISVPVITKQNELIAFISVSGPDFRFTKEIIYSLSDRIISIGNEIGQSL